MRGQPYGLRQNIAGILRIIADRAGASPVAGRIDGQSGSSGTTTRKNSQLERVCCYEPEKVGRDCGSCALSPGCLPRCLCTRGQLSLESSERGPRAEAYSTNICKIARAESTTTSHSGARDCPCYGPVSGGRGSNPTICASTRSRQPKSFGRAGRGFGFSGASRSSSCAASTKRGVECSIQPFKFSVRARLFVCLWLRR